MSRQVTEHLNTRTCYSNKMLSFRKNSMFQLEEKYNNSMIVLKDKEFINNADVEKRFFDKRRVLRNCSKMGKENNEKTLQNEEKKYSSENENVNHEKLVNGKEDLTQFKKLRKDKKDQYDIITSKRSLDIRFNQLQIKKELKDEILLLRSEVVKEKKANTAINNPEYVDNPNLESPYKSCLICDNYFHPGNVIILECFHIFCLNCAKLFYEEKIDQGKKELNCPIFKCLMRISTEIIKNLVTLNYYEKLIKKLEITEEKQNFLLNRELCGTVDLSAKKSTIFIENHEINSKKNILEIKNNFNIQFYTKNIEHFCKNCKKESLFGKNSRNLIKCMNCLLKFCKHCGKIFSSSHFDFSGNNYCKIFLRKNKKPLPLVKNHFKEFFLDFILFLLGYFVFIFGVLNYINLAITDLLKFRDHNNNNCCTHFFQILLLIIISIIVLPILFMTLPFYPFIVAIFK